MTPKEKADELIDKYIQFHPYYSKDSNLKKAIGSSLIAVDEIIDISQGNILKFYSDVKEEIIKLKTPSNEVRSY